MTCQGKGRDVTRDHRPNVDHVIGFHVNLCCRPPLTLYIITMQSDSRTLLTSNASASSSSATGKPVRLYVGNLSPSVDEYTLIQVFQKYGQITKLDFMFHKTGVLKGKPRGYAFVEFSSKDVSRLVAMRWGGVGANGRTR
jgi:hypothetical protein